MPVLKTLENEIAVDFRLDEGWIVLDVVDQPIDVPKIGYSWNISKRPTGKSLTRSHAPHLSTGVRVDCCD